MKILHCVFSLTTGGTETMLIDILNEQAKNNKVSLIIVNDSIDNHLVDQIDRHVQIFKLDRKPRSRNPFFILKLNYLVRKINASVIHVHDNSLLFLIFFPTGPMFLTVHALNVPLSYARHATCLFAISDAVAEDIKSRCNQKTIVVPNGIVLENILCRDNRLPKGNFKIVNVARLDKSTKGQDILIEAVGKLKKEGLDNIEVDFIGEGKSKKELKQLVKNLCLENQIHFLGLRDRRYIYSHLKDYDMMCHPSRYEGFGLTVAEGIAAKLPVLVASGDGPSEIIKHGELGTIFKNSCSDDCALKLSYIIKNYQQLQLLVQPAYNHILENYSVKRMVDQYLRAYLN